MKKMRILEEKTVNTNVRTYRKALTEETVNVRT